MAARVIIVALCLAAIVALVQRRHDAEDCRDARTAALAQVAAGAVDDATVEQVADRCRDPEQVAVTANGIARVDPRAALRLARVAVDRAPDSFSSWAALTVALRRAADPAAAAEADRAERRALALNPRWRPPARPAAGAAP